ncbi:hypothetical protein [Thermobrachium celere]|uniref:hypothetical protein n=1 Tax=Thermobrachium celere TaxID=53422 RepID=UPI0019448D29|nr:hypothetical protein [Thermobrachium celere]GFR35446.1 hypothetical protein TCEA9_12580 [Thermobrachium celere]
MVGLFDKIINATKVVDIKDIIHNLEKDKMIRWKPVGGYDSNCGIIEMNSDPVSSMVERITNAIDAVLEKEFFIKQKELNGITIESPRKLIELIYGIKEGRLENCDEKIFELMADNVSIILRDSGNDDKPTVDFRDKGIGIKADEFSDTILSLNKGRKIKKLYLIGAYGQGGSTSFSTSVYTVIISRKLSTDNNPEKVAFTIVRYNPGILNVDKIGLYEYMVNSETDLPFEEEVKLDKFKEGTLVRHIEMDIRKYKTVITAPTSSLWYITHHYLFDTIYPFWIEDKRSNKKNERRIVKGNYRRLFNDDKQLVKYKKSADIKFGNQNSKIKITWWVLHDKKINNYTSSSKPIIITFNGQKHGDLDSSLIKKDLNLPYLDGYLIVHVNCDYIDAETKRYLFASTREAIKQTETLEKLKNTIIDVLKSDEMLRKYDSDIKSSFLKNMDENISKKNSK